MSDKGGKVWDLMGGSNIKRRDRLTALLPSLDGLLTSLLSQGSNEPKKQHNQIRRAESRVNIVKPLLHVSTLQTLYPLASKSSVQSFVSFFKACEQWSGINAHCFTQKAVKRNKCSSLNLTAFRRP